MTTIWQQFREIFAVMRRCADEGVWVTTLAEKDRTVRDLMCLGASEDDARWAVEGYIAWCRRDLVSYDWEWFRESAREAVVTGDPLWSSRPAREVLP